MGQPGGNWSLSICATNPHGDTGCPPLPPAPAHMAQQLPTQLLALPWQLAPRLSPVWGQDLPCSLPPAAFAHEEEESFQAFFADEDQALQHSLLLRSGLWKGKSVHVILHLLKHSFQNADLK